MNFRKSISFLSFMLLPITLNYFAPVLIVQSSFEGTFTMMHIIYGLMIISAIFFGEAWCRYLCPMAMFVTIGKKIEKLLKIPSLEVVSDDKKCTKCKKCTKSCVMGLQVNEMVKEGHWNRKECINCGECVKSCSCGAINIKWKKD